MFGVRIVKVAEGMVEGVVKELTIVGNQIIDDLLQASIKQPSQPPFYQGGVQHVLVPRRTLGVIHDSGTIYGPWLEGTSKKNETTRFKGYASFRRGSQRIDELGGRILPAVVSRWVSKVNKGVSL